MHDLDIASTTTTAAALVLYRFNVRTWYPGTIDINIIGLLHFRGFLQECSWVINVEALVMLHVIVGWQAQ